MKLCHTLEIGKYPENIDIHLLKPKLILLQSKTGSHVEVHSIRGSQVILRARVPQREDRDKRHQREPNPATSLPVSRVGSFKMDEKHRIKPTLNRSLSDTLYRSCSVLKLRSRCQLMEQSIGDFTF